MTHLIFTLVCVLLPFLENTHEPARPGGLTVNFLLHPDRVILDGYRVNTGLVGTSPENQQEGKGDMWDSGKILSDHSINVRYGGSPLEPGYCRIRIKPQPGSLETATIKHPTIRGDVVVAFVNKTGESFEINVEIPANMTAEIHLPMVGSSPEVTQNNKIIKCTVNGNFLVIENAGSGRYGFKVAKQE